MAGQEAPKQVRTPHGAKAAEVYGIVGYLLSLIFFVLWILWAYTPDWVMTSLGITYYPSRYWAIAAPLYGITLVIYLIIIYNAWNLCNTNPFESIYTVRDSATMPTPVKDKDMQALQAVHLIPPAEDMPITQVNMELFGGGRAAALLRARRSR